MNQKTCLFFFSILLALFFLEPGIVYSQSGSIVDSDTLKAVNVPEREIILSPGADPYVYYDPYGESYNIQNGIFIGPSHIGAETTYRQPDSPYFGSLFGGIISGRDSGVYWTGGLTFGWNFQLSQSGHFIDRNLTELYFRLGPGVGMAGKGVLNSSESELYLGINTTAFLGAQRQISRRSSIYMQGGGRVLWFPALSEIGFMSVPMISLGLQFSSSPEVPMIRY